MRGANFRRIGRRLERLVPKGRVLDVGCGSGVFLDAMRRRGWVVAGLEPHKSSAYQLRTTRGLDVTDATLDQVSSEWGPFDAVSLLDVLEHLSDPRRALRKVWHLLRPGGVLVLATPNVDSLEHGFFGASWYALQPPDHLWLFSARSLMNLLVSAGLGSAFFAVSPVSYAWPSLLRRLRLPPPPAPLDTAMKAIAAPPMFLAAGVTGAPAQLEVYARKLES
ncbi:MAG: class I SAM-dependent methyltransferase [Chloroflexi bacterium]|nr:class I SAM-dependent methyltransferase [Chloroflexota bacterium]